MTFLMISHANRVRAFAEAFARDLPEIPFASDPEAVDPAEVRFLMCWRFPEDFADTYPNLEVVFSTGAGIDQVMDVPLPPHVRLVRMIDSGNAALVRDYVVMSVLALHRDLPAYLRQQRERLWNVREFVWSDQRRVGFLGLGEMTHAPIRILGDMGFRLMGWSRSPKQMEDVRTYHGLDGLARMVRETDILVCLLPLTHETRGILNADLFAQLPEGAALVQAGRGGHLDQAALLSSLDSGRLSAAFLDVTDPEPLPSDSPLWTHPKIILTPHVAGNTRAESAASATALNLRRYLDGKVMQGLVEPGRGY